jgi:uncharacterized protein
MPLVFEWDPEKAKNNHRTHRVSFDEACTVFKAPRIMQRGLAGNPQLVLMILCFTLRSDDRIRIIGARLATRRERSDYENYLQK